MILLLTAGSFLSGSLMFSYWLGLLGKKNIKSVGDGNPGALNLWKASGYRLGLLGVLLDFMKGYIPVLLVLSVWSDYASGYWIVPLALAPIAGHAFSPFLKGKGGKAIAVTFGVWSALTSFEASFVYALILALLAVLFRYKSKATAESSEKDGLQVIGGMILLAVYLLVRLFPFAIMLVWAGNFAVLLYTHRKELGSRFGKKQSGHGA
ncbi:glycerol-3-phosphate acyltransferase [Paenibacillus sp. NPDC058071]|uniref:glycerol-3-phosphate acyltransferase n=1 Tax=Paenibacillus sp. NPDC058071 TaxID=3346326 RepID=UPI0036DB6A21